MTTRKNPVEQASWWVSIFGVPALLVGVGITLSWTNDAARTIGGVEARLTRVESDIKDSTALIQSVDGKIATTNQTIAAGLSRIAQRLSDRELSPVDALARVGITAKGDFAAATIDGKVVLFPKTPEAQASLVNSGYSATQLTPFLTGWSFETAPNP